MNSLLLAVVLCCAVAASQAQELPAWLPPMQPYSCLWCSGRYYRRSPQALTTGLPAVGSISGVSSDISLHAGFFYDIIPKYPVKNEKSACIYLVNMYRKDKGPVEATEIMPYINMSFFGPQQSKDYTDKPHPLAFQCCHYKYGRQLMDQINAAEETTTTAAVRQEDDTATEATAVTEETAVTETTETTTTAPRLTGRVGRLNENKGKKTAPRRHRPLVQDETGEETEEVVERGQRRKRQNTDSELNRRTSIRVPTKIDSSAVVVVDDSDDDAVDDKYKARMPDILPEGFTCDTLTRQLYMELSQDNETRQKQIQKAMQRNVAARRAGRNTNNLAPRNRPVSGY